MLFFGTYTDFKLIYAKNYVYQGGDLFLSFCCTVESGKLKRF